MIAASSSARLNAADFTAGLRPSLFKLFRLLCFTGTCFSMLYLVGQVGILLAGCQPASLSSYARLKAPIANRRAGFQPAPQSSIAATKTWGGRPRRGRRNPEGVVVHCHSHYFQIAV